MELVSFRVGFFVFHGQTAVLSIITFHSQSAKLHLTRFLCIVGCPVCRSIRCSALARHELFGLTSGSLHLFLLYCHRDKESTSRQIIGVRAFTFTAHTPCCDRTVVWNSIVGSSQIRIYEAKLGLVHAGWLPVPTRASVARSAESRVQAGRLCRWSDTSLLKELINLSMTIKFGNGEKRLFYMGVGNSSSPVMFCRGLLFWWLHALSAIVNLSSPARSWQEKGTVDLLESFFGCLSSWLGDGQMSGPL